MLLTVNVLGAFWISVQTICIDDIMRVLLPESSHVESTTNTREKIIASIKDCSWSISCLLIMLHVAQ